MLKITASVSMKIFDSPNVKRKVDKIFEGTKEKFQSRFDEIKNFIMSQKDSSVDYSSISYEDVLLRFKEILFGKVALTAVENAFSKENHDLEKNLIDVLSTELVETAIMGHTMIQAFSDAIRKIPTNGGLELGLKGSQILLLEKQFLGINPFRSAASNTEPESKTEEVHATVVYRKAEDIRKWIDEDIDD